MKKLLNCLLELFLFFTRIFILFLLRVRSSRSGINDEAAKLLVERSIRQDKGEISYVKLFLK